MASQHITRLLEISSKVSENPKGQALGATFTTISGISTILNWLPDILGVLATGIGITLTWVMIRKGRLDARRIKLEIKVLERKLDGDDGHEVKLMRKELSEINKKLNRRHDDRKG